MALRKPHSTQVQPFRLALTCVSSLLDFTMMAQYQSHTSATIDYIEQYMMRFHETLQDIFLEFLVSKQRQAKADELGKELLLDRNQLNQSVAQSKRQLAPDEDRKEENDQGI